MSIKFFLHTKSGHIKFLTVQPCSSRGKKEIRTAIKEEPEFETEIMYEPLMMLEAIRTLMYIPLRARYPLSTLVETLSSLFNIKQIQVEKLVDFIERFDQEKQLVKIQLGRHFLDVFVGNTVDCNASIDGEEKTSMKTKPSNNSWPSFFAAYLIRQSMEICNMSIAWTMRTNIKITQSQ